MKFIGFSKNSFDEVLADIGNDKFSQFFSLKKRSRNDVIDVIQGKEFCLRTKKIIKAQLEFELLVGKVEGLGTEDLVALMPELVGMVMNIDQNRAILVTKVPKRDTESKDWSHIDLSPSYINRQDPLDDQKIRIKKYISKGIFNKLFSNFRGGIIRKAQGDEEVLDSIQMMKEDDILSKYGFGQLPDLEKLIGKDQEQADEFDTSAAAEVFRNWIDKLTSLANLQKSGSIPYDFMPWIRLYYNTTTKEGDMIITHLPYSEKSVKFFLLTFLDY